jgi:hypothetical protein
MVGFEPVPADDVLISVPCAKHGNHYTNDGRN